MTLRRIIRWKWWIIIAWISVSILAVVTMPDLGELVREKGQPGIPESYSSQVAETLEKKLNDPSVQKNEISFLAVFTGEEQKLSKKEVQEIEHGVRVLKEQKEELGITQVLTHFDEEALQEQMVSKDGTAILVSLTVERGEQSVKEIRKHLDEVMDTIPVKNYLTGPELINEDFAQTTLDGVRKTEWITVAFIIAVLLLVFRSPLTPFISLLSVAAAYLISLAVVTHFVEHFNFPFANFTQIFLVLVLFGIGTDYNILLFSRFKEELVRGKSVAEAIVETYRTAGKTVVYSGLAVFIGFACLGFARFSIYQAGMAVAIGVLFLLLSLYSIVPTFMSLMGSSVFWPVKRFQGHIENRLWTWLTANSCKRPLISLLVVGLVTCPILFFYHGNLSYNSLEEVDDSYDSVRGFQTVSDHFRPGQTMPTSVLLESDQPLDSQKSLALLDQVTQSLARLDGVEAVYGPTRPNGKMMDGLYMEQQAEKIQAGIGETGEGIERVKGGLNEAAHQMEMGWNQDGSRLDELAQGSESVRLGLVRIQKGINGIQKGMDNGVKGVRQIQSHLNQLESAMKELTRSTKQISERYGLLSQGYKQLGKKYQRAEKNADQVQSVTNQMQQHMQKVEQKYPKLLQDPHFQALKRAHSGLKSQLGEMKVGLNRLNEQYQQMTETFDKANKGINKVSVGHQKMLGGLQQLKRGASQLRKGLEKGAQGQRQIADSLSAMEQGMGRISKGMKTVTKEVGGLEGELSRLKTGLYGSADGLGHITQGLEQAETYLGDLSGTPQTFFVPKQVLNEEVFQRSLDRYMSDDRKVIKWQVVLHGDPYSKQAMEVVDDMDSILQGKLRNLDLGDTRYGIGGITSQNRDLDAISTGDFNRTAIFMLLGISMVLLWILRSFRNTVYIVCSLVLAYCTALVTTEKIFSVLLDYDGLTWTVPFFSMIMVISLGVDYSIFLMMRYREYSDFPPGKAFVHSARSIGSVVISAALILGLTFASLYPSGVLTLVQIATVVIIGLILLAFVMLPILLPALMSLTQALRTVSEHREEKRHGPY
ncbi:MMPL family transporter [Melghirimyces algeriensis]|uniref:Putative drug exporter of the RND superfamily n=1 Tax=Melghirimyces algeriensis TaxID=910412 RepID=A0A521EQD2_9BACL|nr:MMPL family transporter [Melghirimyces algeriensis]SMO85621.1 putative drug exporter of the RND superfamily [Melghirimyces algeriensis]